MNADAMVFAMANPNPEVNPEEAAPYVRIMATGRSDYPNQINNVLCFPGIFRGALDVRAPAITEEMKMAAARAIAAIVDERELREDYIIPSVFNRDVAPAVAAAVADQARAAGIALAGQEVGFAHGDTAGGGDARAAATRCGERRARHASPARPACSAGRRRRAARARLRGHRADARPGASPRAPRRRRCARVGPALRTGAGRGARGPRRRHPPRRRARRAALERRRQAGDPRQPRARHRATCSPASRPPAHRPRAGAPRS